MFRRFLSILCVIILLGTSLAVGASAAVSFDTNIFQPENSVINNINYDYFALFSDTDGYLISLNYLSILSCDVFLDSNNVQFVFTNFFPASYEVTVIVRDIKSGTLIGQKTALVPANGNYTFLLSTLVNGSSFSSFHYYETFPDSHFTLHISSGYFFENTVNWLVPSDDGYLLSVLPEPVSDHSLSYIVIQTKSGRGRLIVFSWTLVDGGLDYLDIQFWVDSAGNYSIRVWNKLELDVEFSWNMYDVSNGFYISSGQGFIDSDDFNYTTINIGANYLNAPYVKTYGVGFFNDYGFPVGQPHILWNYDRLNAEATSAQTLLLLNQLYAINRSLGDIEDLLTLELMDLNLNLALIYDILDRVYNAEPETFEQPTSDALDDYLSDESQVYDVLPTNMVANIDDVFGSGGDVFDGNGAFALIRGLMQGLVFDSPKLSAFVFFSLAIGVAVLILGRKINNA